MGACTSVSAIQLVVVALSFLLAVVWLDVFWVRIPEEMHHGDIAGALRKRSWLNAFVAAGRARRCHPADFLGQRLHQRRLLNLLPPEEAPRRWAKEKPGFEAGLFLRNTESSNPTPGS